MNINAVSPSLAQLQSFSLQFVEEEEKIELIITRVLREGRERERTLLETLDISFLGGGRSILMLLLGWRRRFGSSE